MKKLIAITVMIALFASAAFAQAVVSGALEARLNVFEVVLGDHGEAYDYGHPKPQTGGMFGTANIQIQGSNENGTMGGLFRLRAEDIVNDNFRFHRVFVWWRPIPQVKLFLGQDADGLFETGQLTSWAFHQGSESFLNVHNWDFWRNIFPGNWDTFGAALSFYLVDGLELNLVFPTGKPNGWPRHDNESVTRKIDIDAMYPGSLQFTGSYNIEEVGKIALAWIGSGEVYNDKTENFGKIGLSFYSNSIVQGLAFQVGASYDVKSSDVSDADKSPVSVGAAVHFNTGDFGIKFRVGSDIATNDTGKLFLTANIMPTYKLASVGNICVDFGISINKDNKDADVETGFWINPYLKKSIGGGYFQIGLMILSDISGGQGDNITVNIKNAAGEVRSQPRVYLPMLMGINF